MGRGQEVQRLSVFRKYHERLMAMNELLQPQLDPHQDPHQDAHAAHAAHAAAPAARDAGADDARCAS